MTWSQVVRTRGDPGATNHQAAESIRNTPGKRGGYKKVLRCSRSNFIEGKKALEDAVGPGKSGNR